MWVFGHSNKLWKGHDGQIKKNACKNAYLGSISYLKNTSLGCVLKVFLRGWYPAWNTSALPRKNLNDEEYWMQKYNRRKWGRKKKKKPFSYNLIRSITHAFPNRPTRKYLPLTESHQYVHRPTQHWKEGFLNVAEWGVVEITWQDQREPHWNFSCCSGLRLPYCNSLDLWINRY